jgi:hypothetical protein
MAVEGVKGVELEVERGEVDLPFESEYHMIPSLPLFLSPLFICI